MVTFSDFECPFCKKLADALTATLMDQSKDQDVSVGFKDFLFLCIRGLRARQSWAGASLGEIVTCSGNSMTTGLQSRLS